MELNREVNRKGVNPLRRNAFAYIFKGLKNKPFCCEESRGSSQLIGACACDICLLADNFCQTYLIESEYSPYFDVQVTLEAGA
ncbi:hypothetical protein [Bacillus atrophaeus]|uniref:hypothetical protein n=1 Tax=Bacillus atrophaeus TaxID=1452 RepID=UPI00255BA974|nr:hypothetical protein [Bacillus atrophaeus]MDL5141727.1 hypothetical protein [Bacillus atrophaeus]